MRKSNLAYGDFSERDTSSRAQEFREIDLSTPDDLPLVDLIELYAGIEYALPSDQGLVVQFVSPTSGFGSEQVALDMAWAGASVLGRRMLLLYCNKSERRLAPPHGAQAAMVPVIEPAAAENDIVKVSGHELYLAEWRSWHSKSGALVGADVIDGHLDELRAFFDMIVMIAPPADGDPLAMIMGRHVDGNVIILEAERTRRSAAIRLREILARSGSPIVGAVFNNRRNHVPRWLSRHL